MSPSTKQFQQKQQNPRSLQSVNTAHDLNREREERNLRGGYLAAFTGLVGNGGEDAPDSRIVILERLGGDLGRHGGHELPGALVGLWRCSAHSAIGFCWSGI